MLFRHTLYIFNYICIRYAVYKYIISVSLFNHEAHIFCHSTNNKNDIEIIDKLLKKDVPTNYNFSKKGEKNSNFTDKEFTNLVKKGKTLKINILAPFEILFGDATVVNIKYNNKVVSIPYFNPDTNVGKITVKE